VSTHIIRRHNSARTKLTQVRAVKYFCGVWCCLRQGCCCDGSKDKVDLPVVESGAVVRADTQIVQEPLVFPTHIHRLFPLLPGDHSSVGGEDRGQGVNAWGSLEGESWSEREKWSNGGWKRAWTGCQKRQYVPTAREGRERQRRADRPTMRRAEPHTHVCSLTIVCARLVRRLAGTTE
ncbi:unnamed protein product, partial [Pylaiella littoralis]